MGFNEISKQTLWQNRIRNAFALNFQRFSPFCLRTKWVKIIKRCVMQLLQKNYVAFVFIYLFMYFFGVCLSLRWYTSVNFNVSFAQQLSNSLYLYIDFLAGFISGFFVLILWSCLPRERGDRRNPIIYLNEKEPAFRNFINSFAIMFLKKDNCFQTWLIKLLLLGLSITMGTYTTKTTLIMIAK